GKRFLLSTAPVDDPDGVKREYGSQGAQRGPVDPGGLCGRERKESGAVQGGGIGRGKLTTDGQAGFHRSKRSSIGVGRVTPVVQRLEFTLYGKRWSLKQ